MQSGLATLSLPELEAQRAQLIGQIDRLLSSLQPWYKGMLPSLDEVTTAVRSSNWSRVTNLCFKSNDRATKMVGGTRVQLNAISVKEFREICDLAVDLGQLDEDIRHARAAAGG